MIGRIAPWWLYPGVRVRSVSRDQTGVVEWVTTLQDDEDWAPVGTWMVSVMPDVRSQVEADGWSGTTHWASSPEDLSVLS